MHHIISKLQHHVMEVPKRFQSLSEEHASKRPAPAKWSKKEILGHLCDSAVNNVGRFVKAQYEQPYKVIGYQQDQWVNRQDYQNRPAAEIVQLWVCLNQSIIRVLSAMPGEKYGHLCELPDGSAVTLQWLANDYLEHMEHHLRQLDEVR